MLGIACKASGHPSNRNVSEYPLQCSIIITSYSDNVGLRRIIAEVGAQTAISNNPSDFELLIFEAGDVSLNSIRGYCSSVPCATKTFVRLGVGRGAALNYLITQARGRFIVRIDLRSILSQTYLEDLLNLANVKKVANIGGAMVPKWTSHIENIVSLLMTSKVGMGGGASRKTGFGGFVDSIYLGCFDRTLIPKQFSWFDENYPRISEDSDLNYRLRMEGCKVYLTDEVSVGYFPRNSLRSFIDLAYNYGFGRGIFVAKHRRLGAIRQVVLPFCSIVLIVMVAGALHDQRFAYALIISILSYCMLINVCLVNKIEGWRNKCTLIYGCIAGHIAWTAGFFGGLFHLVKNKLPDRLEFK